jgi:mannan endo-1,4-beta-mannosidase
MTMRLLGRATLSVGVLGAVLLTGTTATATASISSHAAPRVSAAGSCSSAPVPSGHYLGLVGRALPPRTKYLHRFAKATGVRPNLITYYQHFGRRFSASDACMVTGQHALPFIQIEPFAPYTVSGIADGDWDSYLKAYARAVKKFGARIALGFGHEMNGDWEPWGFGHVSPSVFIAAWRHIHHVFAVAGATNVTWVWTINRAEHPPELWWPGSKYVTWVGISGYFRHSFDRWAIVFNSTLASIAEFSTAPILIAETAVGPFRDRPRMIRNLFAGLTRHAQLLGFTYFDLNKSSKTEDWRLDGHKGAIAAYKKAAPAYLRLPR